MLIFLSKNKTTGRRNIIPENILDISQKSELKSTSNISDIIQWNLVNEYIDWLFNKLAQLSNRSLSKSEHESINEVIELENIDVSVNLFCK